jgi:hypothetical protein
MFKLQEKLSALKTEHAEIKKIKFINYFQFLWVIFALLNPDPDTDSGTPLNPEPIRIRIRIHNTAGGPVLLSHQYAELHRREGNRGLETNLAR